MQAASHSAPCSYFVSEEPNFSSEVASSLFGTFLPSASIPSTSGTTLSLLVDSATASLLSISSLEDGFSSGSSFDVAPPAPEDFSEEAGSKQLKQK